MRLKDDLGNALAEASFLRSELEGGNITIEYWKSQHEPEGRSRELEERVSHQSALVQIAVRHALPETLKY